jgi:predicted nucleotidyltransferase
MMDEPSVEQISQRIVAALNPQRIVLFGSRARGDAGPDSDIDLLIEMPSDLPPTERIRAVDRLFTPRSWPLDVVVFTPGEASAQRLSRNSLVCTAEREGRVLYERSG